MSLRLTNITFDCHDAARVARFWSAVLRRPIDEGAGTGFASIGSDDSSQPGWFFIEVPEGKAVKNRVHVDLVADDRDAEVARLVELGAARHADHDELGHHWTTMTDVEGNEFCVAS
jgi:hypothetical protein